MLTRCPSCGATAFDSVQMTCQACGMAGTTTPVFDDAAVAGLMHNIRLAMQTLELGSFQQVIGPFSERQGHDLSDAVGFSKQTCEIMHRACLSEKILAMRVAVTTPGHTEWSLVVANDPSGIQNAITDVRKQARQMRVQIHVYRQVPNA